MNSSSTTDISHYIPSFLETAETRRKEGKISTRVSLTDLIKSEEEFKEVVLARIEGFVKAGAVIEPEVLEKVAKQIGFDQTDFKTLVPAFDQGIREGITQEPENHYDYGIRLANALYVTKKAFCL